MPLEIVNAAVGWELAPQAPTAAQQAGAGGPAQPLAASLLLSGAASSWEVVPLIPTTAQLEPSVGPAQSFLNRLVLVSAGTSWSVPTSNIVQPRISAQRGAGGPIQDLAGRLFVVAAQTSWTLEAQTLAARFDHVIAPDGFSVLFTDRSGGRPDLLAWDFGDGDGGAGPTPSHIYAAPGAYTVALTGSRVRGFESAPLRSVRSRVIQISTLAQPDESLEDVLNLEVGFHAYEPVRTATGDTGENVSFFNQVVNLPAAQAASLLFYSPAQTIRIRQVTATGTGDGLFKLLLNGQIIDVKRSYATHRNVRFDIEEGLKLTVNDTLEVRVENTSSGRQSYDGALLGRTVA